MTQFTIGLLPAKRNLLIRALAAGILHMSRTQRLGINQCKELNNANQIKSNQNF